MVRLAFEYYELLKCELFDEEAELSNCGYYLLYVLFVLLLFLDSFEPVFDLCLNIVSLVPEMRLPIPSREELVLAAPYM